MRGISLWQPMASAPFDGGKCWENRPRRTHVRGLVVIHAAKKVLEAAYFCTLDQLWPQWRNQEHPRGVLLGIVNLSDCKPIDEVRGQRWAYGPWCWRIDPVVKFTTPIPFKAKQGFFMVPASVLPDEAHTAIERFTEAMPA